MKIHQIQGYIQTIHLVEYHDRLMLLDAGCRCDVRVIEQFVQQQLGRSMQELKLVLVSHMHPDHAGGANLLRRKFSCQIASVSLPQQWYQGIRGRIGHAVDIVLALYVARRKGKALKNIIYHPHLRPDIVLCDQQTIPGFSEWTVHSTPGHTDRDLSFLHQPSGQMYVGDMILRIRNKFTSPFPIYQPKAYKQSLAKLLTLEVNTILMAHDGPADISAAEIQTLINNSSKRPLTAARVVKYKLKNRLFSGTKR